MTVTGLSTRALVSDPTPVISSRTRIRGLWNNKHVDEDYNPTFLSVLERYVESTTPLKTPRR